MLEQVRRNESCFMFPSGVKDDVNVNSGKATFKRFRFDIV